VERRIVEFEHGLLVGFLRRRIGGQNRGSNERQYADEADDDGSHVSPCAELDGLRPCLSECEAYRPTRPKGKVPATQVGGTMKLTEPSLLVRCRLEHALQG